MNTSDLLEYANRKIIALGLGPGGRLGSEHVVAYDDAGPGRVRISDGQSGDDIATSHAEIDAALQSWVDWMDAE